MPDVKPGHPCPRCAGRLLPSREWDEVALCIYCGFVAFAKRVATPLPARLRGAQRKGWGQARLFDR